MWRAKVELAVPPYEEAAVRWKVAQAPSSAWSTQLVFYSMTIFHSTIIESQCEQQPSTETYFHSNINYANYQAGNLPRETSCHDVDLKIPAG